MKGSKTNCYVLIKHVNLSCQTKVFNKVSCNTNLKSKNFISVAMAFKWACIKNACWQYLVAFFF